MLQIEPYVKVNVYSGCEAHGGDRIRLGDAVPVEEDDHPGAPGQLEADDYRQRLPQNQRQNGRHQLEHPSSQSDVR